MTNIYENSHKLINFKLKNMTRVGKTSETENQVGHKCDYPLLQLPTPRAIHCVGWGKFPHQQLHAEFLLKNSVSEFCTAAKLDPLHDIINPHFLI